MARFALPPDWRSRVVAGARVLAIGRCEDTPNRGQIPDYCTRTNGGDIGEYWCCDFACTVFHRSLGLASPLLKSGSCEQQRQRAISRRALRTRHEFDELMARDPLAVAGWLSLCIGPDQHGAPHAHHISVVGIVGDDGAITVAGTRGGFLVSEGNAADPEKTASRNGDGAYSGRERGHAHDATTYEFIDPAALAAA